MKDLQKNQKNQKKGMKHTIVKKLNDNPYKESSKKEDWASGWDKAQSEESDAYKGY